MPKNDKSLPDLNAANPAKPEAPQSLFRHANFLTLWAGDTISQFGAQLAMLAIPVLAVSLLHAGELQVGLLNAAETAAFLVIGLPAGAWVDRWLKRRVMITADLVRMLALLVIPALWVFGELRMWQVYAVAAVVGAATVFFDVSYQSYLPILVAGNQVSDANAKLQATQQISRIGGPAAAGGLLAVITAPALLFGTAIGYLTSALCVWRIRDDERMPDPATRQSLRREIAEGIRYVWKHPLLKRITATTAASNLASTISFTMLPILVLRELDLGAAGLGVMMSFGSIGGLLGALATPWLARKIGEGTLIPMSGLVAGVFAFLIPVAALVPNVALPILMFAEFGLSFTVLVYNITQVTMRQRVCPPRLLGRMNASIRFVVWGIMPIAGVLSGVLGTGIGVVPTMWVGAICGVLACGFVVFSPLMGMRTLPTEEYPAS